MCMKIIISETQFNQIMTGEVDEIRTKEKDRYGMGMSHKVYPSMKDPDMLYKIGSESVVNEWVDLFKSRPDLFPKVYKIGDIRVPRKNFRGDIIGYIDKKYVAIERLDDKRADLEWGMIDDFFMSKDMDSFLSYIRKWDESGRILGDMADLIFKQKPELFDIYIRFLTLIMGLQGMKEILDLHAEQFGYDKDGNLKCLDI